IEILYRRYLSAKIYFWIAKINYGRNLLEPFLICLDQAIELLLAKKSNEKACIYLAMKAKVLILHQKWSALGETLRRLSAMKKFCDIGIEILIDQIENYLNRKHSTIYSKQSRQQSIDAFNGRRNCFEFDSNLDIGYSEDRGRFIHCREGSIPYGTHIIREKVISTILHPNFYETKCSYCHKNLKTNSFPCRRCIQVYFCDIECERNSFNYGFHRFECGMLHIRLNYFQGWHLFRLLSSIGLKKALDYFKIRLRNRNRFEDQEKNNCRFLNIVKDLNQQRIEFAETDNPNYYTKVLSLLSLFLNNCPKEQFDSDSSVSKLKSDALNIILMIAWNEIKRNKFEIKSFETQTLIYDPFFVDEKNFIEYLNNTLRDNLPFLIQNLVEQIRILTFITFGLCEPSVDLFSNKTIVAGDCLCLLGSLINHSCQPNAYWDIDDGFITITTCDSIKNRVEIRISYGEEDNESVSKRIEWLKNRYGFLCDCHSCTMFSDNKNELLK
ncbi:hypothetical protein SSS_01721, partial [Sarcoptes scabiei]